MKLYTYLNESGKVVYGTSVNGKSFFFFGGFASAEEAKEAILSRYTGVERTWLETALVGEWSEIQ